MWSDCRAFIARDKILQSVKKCIETVHISKNKYNVEKKLQSFKKEYRKLQSVKSE